MKRSGKSLQSKARRLLRLYSRWNTTRDGQMQQECLTLLSEIMTEQPRFNLRRIFSGAF
ncbi:MAG: hypothetical protein ACOY3K_01890 [Candidatus Omnitrophota bacterium]